MCIYMAASFLFSKYFTDPLTVKIYGSVRHKKRESNNATLNKITDFIRFFTMVPARGFEPPTHWLRWHLEPISWQIIAHVISVYRTSVNSISSIVVDIYIVKFEIINYCLYETHVSIHCQRTQIEFILYISWINIAINQ